MVPNSIPFPDTVGQKDVESVYGEGCILHVGTNSQEGKMIAGSESQVFKDRWDWKMNPDLFRRIQQTFGPQGTDFLHPESQHNSHDFSWRLDLEAKAIDAFKQSRQENNYANPPWAIISCILSEVKMLKASLVHIAPVVEVPGMVLITPNLLPVVNSTILQVHTIPLPIKGHEVSAGCMAFIRKSCEEKYPSKEATYLLMPSWWVKSQSNYNSLFHKWECWCHSYHSAISSVHEKVDGHLVGQHPMLARILKGAFNSRLHKPRYTSTWSVN